jgi:hypothetical protein
MSMSSATITVLLTPLRRVVIAATVAALMWVLARLVLSEAYRAQTTFLPFDLQFPLTQFMIAIELGVFKRGTATAAYAAFAAADLVYAVAVAWFFTGLWVWLFAAQPSRLFHFLKRGGILMLPWYIVAMDAANKIGFYLIVDGRWMESYGEIVNVVVTVHRLKFAMSDIRDYLTLGFLVVAGLSVLQKMRAPKS